MTNCSTTIAPGLYLKQINGTWFVQNWATDKEYREMGKVSPPLPSLALTDFQAGFLLSLLGKRA